MAEPAGDTTFGNIQFFISAASSRPAFNNIHSGARERQLWANNESGQTGLGAAVGGKAGQPFVAPPHVSWMLTNVQTPPEASL